MGSGDSVTTIDMAILTPGKTDLLPQLIWPANKATMNRIQEMVLATHDVAFAGGAVKFIL